MIFTAKYVRVRLTNITCFFVTYVTQDGVCTAFSHPSPPSHMEPGNVPYASHATSYPRQQHNTFAFLSLFLISNLIKISKKDEIFFVYFQTRPSKFRPHTHLHTYHEGSGFKHPSLISWFAMGGTWDLDPDDFLLRGFFLDFLFKWGLVLADWSPPLP